MTMVTTLAVAPSPAKASTPARKPWRVALAAFITFFLLGVGGGVAFAGQAISQNGYSTVNGRSYVNRAVINTSSGQAYAVTNNAWNGGGTPAGQAGARGRLFTSGGALSCEGSNSYNSTAGTTAVGSSCARSTSGAWYSYGVGLGWTGSGYSSFYTYKSPNQNS